MERLPDLLAKVKASKDELDRIAETHVPRSIKDAIRDEWPTTFRGALGEYLERLSKHDMARGNTRVMSIATAVDTIMRFEQRTIRDVVGDDGIAVWIKPLFRAVRKIEFLAENMGKIIIALYESGKLLSPAGEAILDFLDRLKSRLAQDKQIDEIADEIYGDYTELEKAILGRVAAMVEMMIWSATALMIADTVNAWTKAGIFKGLVFTRANRTAAIADSVARSFPQARRRCYRKKVRTQA